jgi:hypothetical protein
VWRRRIVAPYSAFAPEPSGYTAGMQPRFQFTIRRLLVGTTLVAVGMGCWPVALAIDRSRLMPSASPGVAVTAIALCLVAMVALPFAGVGLLVARTRLGQFVWLVAGAGIGFIGFVAILAIQQNVVSW